MIVREHEFVVVSIAVKKNVILSKIHFMSIKQN